ncbi:MAG: histidinol dehydrogenase [Saccharofermentanaceae bacterium]|jgi:histidinol dehydrogenase|nr:histidinol dehydrogenase [Saccharofermentans sp.]HPE27296.1 histidinol dehydrogenase [Saccharofermentans sp.]HPQ32793.1 histidinol dehydrogenase [Saccharofermentans sp.]HRV51368.1 histidinol dehydrogenase [Saccharofermentans sp.]HUM23692.1 histidinol dehydrogenase [Saccharofermentans sp.]
MKCKMIKGTSENLNEICKELGLREKMVKKDVVSVVEDVLNDIKANGDEAVLKYTEKFDGVTLTSQSMKITKEEIDEAMKEIDPELMSIIQMAAKNIRTFHEKQKEEGFMMETGKGAQIGVKVRPLTTVGVYVPGGTAPLPSTVLMDCIPASVAGVKNLVFCTPPQKDGKIASVILVAATIAGATEIYKVGGAQAIGAMAYGTQTIPQVDKICGPGNIYVNTAKRLVFGQVDIDMFAGPSEILIIADDSAEPEFVAADMLSQAEHDVMASAIVLTTSQELANEVLKAVDRRSDEASRTVQLEKSLKDYCAIIVVDDIKTAIEFSEKISPEHLELCVENSDEVLEQINNAGAVFIGNYTPEPLGDYFAGPNHTLPTSGTARFFSPLNTGDFYKKMSILNYNKESLEQVASYVEKFAYSEGLECHAKAIEARMKND